MNFRESDLLFDEIEQSRILMEYGLTDEAHSALLDAIGDDDAVLDVLRDTRDKIMECILPEMQEAIDRLSSRRVDRLCDEHDKTLQEMRDKASSSSKKKMSFNCAMSSQDGMRDCLTGDIETCSYPSSLYPHTTKHVPQSLSLIRPIYASRKRKSL